MLPTMLEFGLSLPALIHGSIGSTAIWPPIYECHITQARTRPISYHCAYSWQFGPARLPIGTFNNSCVTMSAPSSPADRPLSLPFWLLIGMRCRSANNSSRKRLRKSIQLCSRGCDRNDSSPPSNSGKNQGRLLWLAVVRDPRLVSRLLQPCKVNCCLRDGLQHPQSSQAGGRPRHHAVLAALFNCKIKFAPPPPSSHPQSPAGWWSRR